jgi:hypothetical protein
MKHKQEDKKLEDYRDATINIDSLNLDVKNPRFASYHNRINSSSISESDAVEYLLNNKKAKISELAQKIYISKGLFRAEPVIVAEPQTNGIYTVLEGNRRICACKVMKAIFNQEQHSWLTQAAIDSFPNLSNSSQSDKDFIDSLANIKIGIYRNKDLAQPFIISKHNGGVEGWSSEEKNFNYYEKYQEIKSATPSKSFTQIVDEIYSLTNRKKDNIRKAIKFYSVFDFVLTTFDETDRNAVPPDVAFLPLVQVFMPHLCGELKDNGNKLNFNDEAQRYNVPVEREEIFKKIITLVGRAFLVRRSNDNPSRISTTEIKKPNSPASVINETRLEGLKSLIDEYNSIPVSYTQPTTTPTSTVVPPPTPTQPHGEINGNWQGNNTTATPADDIFEPQTPTIYTPRQARKTSLGFEKAEFDTFIFADDATDKKIYSFVYELSKLDVYSYPNAVSLLYLHLLELVTTRTITRNKLNIPGVNHTKMIYLTDNTLNFEKNERGAQGAIKIYLADNNFIALLNDYKHTDKQVDCNILIESWKTLKEYIKACLTL